VLRRRVAALMAAVGMVVLMGVLASVTWAAPVAPRVVSTVPPNGTTGVALDANIKAKFSEAMKERSINTTTFYLYPGHLTYDDLNGCGPVGCRTPVPVAGTVRYNADNKTAILDPTTALLCNTEYTALIEGTGDGDMVAFKDRGGTPMASDKIFYFTTGTAGGDGGPCHF
jgi:Bacterial Ig-like domain